MEDRFDLSQFKNWSSKIWWHCRVLCCTLRPSLYPVHCTVLCGTWRPSYTLCTVLCSTWRPSLYPVQYCAVLDAHPYILYSTVLYLTPILYPVQYCALLDAHPYILYTVQYLAHNSIVPHFACHLVSLDLVKLYARNSVFWHIWHIVQYNLSYSPVTYKLNDINQAGSTLVFKKRAHLLHFC